MSPSLVESHDLDGNTYVWHLDLVALLEVLGESLDEFLSGNVLDSNSTTGVDCSKLDLYL
jgi:hypothetical protein